MTVRKLEIYGDSVLRGVMYDTDRKRYTLCGTRADALNALCERGIETKNYSRMGATVGKGLELLTKNLPEDARGTAVLLEYGGNDCDFDWSAVSENPRGTFEPHTPRDEFLAGYRKMVDLIRARGGTPILSSLVPIDAEKYFSWISAGRKGENILAWLGDVSMLARWQEQYSRTVERLAYELNVPLLDFRAAFLTAHNYPALLCADGIHPTEEGHGIINRVLERVELGIGN